MADSLAERAQQDEATRKAAAALADRAQKEAAQGKDTKQ